MENISRNHSDLTVEEYLMRVRLAFFFKKKGKKKMNIIQTGSTLAV
jgi:hypothetical protein